MSPHLPPARRRLRRAFTLVELLVVIGVIAILIGVLLPALSKARQASTRAKCLSNVRQLCVAQVIYAVTYRNALVAVADGGNELQGSWITLLEGAKTVHLARRCPADFSRYFGDQPLPGTTPPAYRMTSYAINNYVSPTHAPVVPALTKITQVRRSSAVIQFAELVGIPVGGANNAGSDHIHANDFNPVSSPAKITIGRIAQQMPLGQHGGGQRDWQAMLNYGFIDGHAESLRTADVYTDPTRNKFDPAVAQ